MPRIGTFELLVIAFVILLLFGGKKIPEFSRGIGEAINEFRRKSSEDQDSPPEKEDK